MANAAQQLRSNLGIEKKDSWDEIRDMLEVQTVNVIHDTSINVTRIAAEVEAMGTLPAELQEEFSILKHGVMRDLKTYADRYAALYDRRNGRTGFTTDTSDYTDYILIGTEHVSLFQEIGSVIPVGLSNLMEHYQVAYDIYQSQRPDVVTDVEPKEPTAEATTEQSQ